MGQCSEVCRIGWIPLVIYGSSFLRALLMEYGYALDEGLILVADSEAQSRRFIGTYCESTGGNGYRMKTWNSRSIKPGNYCCALLPLKKSNREEAIEDFLSEQDFVPIVVAGGLLPEYLRTDRYIFRLGKEDVKAVSSVEFAEKIRGFRNFITKKISTMCKILERAKSSIILTEYDGDEETQQIFSACVVIALIYAEYLRETKTEREIADFLSDFVSETREKIQKMSEFASGEELPEMLSALIWEVVSSDEKIKVVDITLVNGTAYTSLKEKSAILFDDKFYYFPPELFLKICEPLRQTASTTQLKKRMRKDGIIHCNSADHTVKKEITNVFGAKETQRFIWVYKEYLLSEDNLRLEDVFGHITEEE